MSQLNQYALSRFLGSTMKPINPPVFGRFGLVETIAETIHARTCDKRPRSQFTMRQDRLLAKSFERIREGAPPDALLYNPDFAKQLADSCQKNGLDFPQQDLVRRILAIRKNPAKYARNGIRFSPTTKKDEYPSLLAEYAPVVEFTLVRLRYRYGSSIDEILIDPILGGEFERIARSFLPDLDVKAMRQTALTLRKSRFVPRARRKDLRKLNAKALEEKWSAYQPLVGLSSKRIPSGPGLVEIREGSRDLYISRNANLLDMIQLLTRRSALSIMENSFWKPSLQSIEARFIPATVVPSDGLESWELKLLCERQPVFNWPITKSAA